MPSDRLKQVLRQATGSLGALLDKIDVPLLLEITANESELVLVLAGAPYEGIIQDLKWLAERHEGALLETLAAIICRLKHP